MVLGVSRESLVNDMVHFTRSKLVYCVDDFSWADEFFDREDDKIADSQQRLSFGIDGSRFLDVPKVIFKKATFTEIPSIVRGGIDILIIDHDKRTNRLLQCLQLLVPRMNPGGLIVGSGWDGLWSAQVRLAVRSYWLEGQFSIDKLLFNGDYLSECFWKRVDETEDN